MPNIKSVLTLQDNMSTTLSKIERQAIANAAAFEKYEKQAHQLKDQLDALNAAGKGDTEVADNLRLAYEHTGDIAREYADNVRQAKVDNDNLNSSMTEINQTLEVAQKAWNLLSKAIQEASRWMEISNNQFNSEFTSAVKMHGVLGANQEEIESMYKYASALQKVGVVGDEATLAGMSTLSMYADNIEQVKKLTPAVLDLAVAENGLETSQASVESTAQRLGYALNGNATVLKRMIGASDSEIKKLNSINDKNEKAEYLFEMLEKRVGGVNETLADTAQGSMMQANNSLGDLQERLGTQVVPYFAAFQNILVSILEPIVAFAEANSNWLIPTIIALITGIGVLIAVLTVLKLVNLLVAASEMAVLWPLLILIAMIAAFILAVNLAAQVLSDWSGTAVSAMGLVFGALNVMLTALQNVFIDLFNACQFVIDGISQLFISLGQLVIGIINEIAAAIDYVFGTNLSAQTEHLLSELNAAKQAINEDPGFIERKSYTDAYESGYDYGANLFKGVNASGASTGNLGNWLSGMDDINKNLDGLIGTDGAGGKALKTTSNDNLLSDEDVQLLLDIATRDYQLSYQQVTPNVTVSFGDVRETADVNQVLDVVGTRIEELIYGDAEVVY